MRESAPRWPGERPVHHGSLVSRGITLVESSHPGKAAQARLLVNRLTQVCGGELRLMWRRCAGSGARPRATPPASGWDCLDPRGPARVPSLRLWERLSLAWAIGGGAGYFGVLAACSPQSSRSSGGPQQRHHRR